MSRPDVRSWTDNKTAAEHYIAARWLGRGPDDVRGDSAGHELSYGIFGWIINPMYDIAKSTPVWQHFMGRASDATWNQLKWQEIGWWDGVDDNLNKVIKTRPGEYLKK